LKEPLRKQTLVVRVRLPFRPSTTGRCDRRVHEAGAPDPVRLGDAGGGGAQALRRVVVEQIIRPRLVDPPVEVRRKGSGRPAARIRLRETQNERVPSLPSPSVCGRPHDYLQQARRAGSATAFRNRRDRRVEISAACGWASSTSSWDQPAARKPRSSRGLVVASSTRPGGVPALGSRPIPTSSRRRGTSTGGRSLYADRVTGSCSEPSTRMSPGSSPLEHNEQHGITPALDRSRLTRCDSRRASRREDPSPPRRLHRPPTPRSATRSSSCSKPDAGAAEELDSSWPPCCGIRSSSCETRDADAPSCASRGRTQPVRVNGRRELTAPGRDRALG